ncbi:hypothetical protein [Bacillus sp. FJAT-50079]|uniref:hypothetical protein n=1 Tax=Bacillus sp. FJAT-50079 TaxID=2833577 RepID=UPI001BC9935E|nr:hypothetical protein [Bacillus sp. FJAT-50079]MBS4210675.1 hypothetical protein [Bacillus sp. FJAT-50079]
MKTYHCCATCIHFSAKREGKQMIYRCERLGFDTETHYQFDCWVPKDHVKKLMDKRQ